VFFGVEPAALDGRCLSGLERPELTLGMAVGRGVESSRSLGGMLMP
jgi:hypothetical protein